MPISCDRVRDLAPGFVLGALDAAEMAAVREHLSSCSMPHPELRELGGVVSYIGGSLEPVEPPRHLRAAVLAAVAADMAAHAPVAKAAPVVALPVDSPELGSAANVVSLASVRRIRARRAAGWLVRVAAVVVVVASVGYSVSVQNDLNNAETNKAHTAAVLHAASQPGARAAVLTASKDQLGGGDAVLLPTGHLVVNLHGLAPTTADEVYMVWLSTDGGAIAKGAWFTVDNQGEGYLEMDSIPPLDSLWLMICREPNVNVSKPGPAVVTGTIWVFSAPAPTPTK
jgi:hypothetical protein